MLVADASAVIDLLLGHSSAASVAGHIADHGYPVHAPQVLDLEVLSGLRRVVASGDASTERADMAMGALLAMPLERHPHQPLVRRAWGYRHNFTPYDASYLVLAEVLTAGGATLLTTDARFARAARTHGNIEVVLAQ
jgi:predicted nucleic acid-binding protein